MKFVTCDRCPRPLSACLLADARLLLLHGHGNKPSEAKSRHADIASHFVLKLACCGGSVGPEGGGLEEDRRAEDASRQRDRREWFVRAEKDLFEARLRWHLQGSGVESGSEQVG